jgi:hypothetical protein
MNCDQFNTPLLDTVDTIIKEVSNVDDRVFIDEIMDDVPCALVVGDQSTGKSSVTRRLCNVPLETDSKRCTVIPTHIACRRRQTTKFAVTLQPHNGEEIQVHTGDDASGLESALTKAKEDALRSSGQEFVTDAVIRLEHHGPKESNYSFVDYPGFTSKNADDAKAVTSMVERRIQSPNAIVLHVVRGDMDVGAIAGGVFMNEINPHHRIVICTHCDQPKAKEYLMSILEYAGASNVFAVIGNEDNDATEVERLQKYVDPSQFQLGIQALRTHLEEILQEHTRKQIPILRKTLVSKRDASIENLANLDLGAPTDVVQATLTKAKQRWSDQQLNLANKVRDANEEIVRSLRNYALRPPNSDEECWRPMQTSDLADMVEGDRIKYKDYKTWIDSTFVSSKQSDVIHVAYAPTRESAPMTKFKVRGSQNKDLMGDVLQRCQDRGLRNMLDTDVQPILVAYAREYAKYCEPILNQHVESIESLVKDSLETTFRGSEFADSASNVIKHLASLATAKFAERRPKVEELVADLVACNAEEELCYATDDHYYNDMYQKMLSDDEVSLATDEGASLSIVFKIRARNKDARKSMTFAMKKLVWLELGVRFSKDLETIIETQASEIAHHVKIPGWHESKITNLKQQISTLNRCIDLCQNCA